MYILNYKTYARSNDGYDETIKPFEMGIVCDAHPYLDAHIPI